MRGGGRWWPPRTLEGVSGEGGDPPYPRRCWGGEVVTTCILEGAGGREVVTPLEGVGGEVVNTPRTL